MNSTNLPIIISSTVAISSILISIVKLFRENDAGSKRIKRISDLTNVYIKLPEKSSARADTEELLAIEISKVKDILTRKMNIANLLAVVFVAVLGGLISYLLLLWATNTSLIFAIIAWTLFGFVALFTIGLAVVGLASIYNDEKKKDK